MQGLVHIQYGILAYSFHCEFYIITLMDILIEIFSHAGISTYTIWYFSIIISIVGFT